MQKKNRLWLIIFVLAAVSLACNLSIFSPKTPAPPIPVTTEAVQSLEETAQNAYDDFQQSGTVKLTITEAQLTSLVAIKLAESGDQTITNPRFTYAMENPGFWHGQNRQSGSDRRSYRGSGGR